MLLFVFLNKEGTWTRPGGKRTAGTPPALASGCMWGLLFRASGGPGFLVYQINLKPEGCPVSVVRVDDSTEILASVISFTGWALSRTLGCNSDETFTHDTVIIIVLILYTSSMILLVLMILLFHRPSILVHWCPKIFLWENKTKQKIKGKSMNQPLLEVH